MNRLLEFLKNIYRKIRNRRQPLEPVIPEIYPDNEVYINNSEYNLGNTGRISPLTGGRLSQNIGSIFPDISKEIDFKKPTTVSDEGIISSSVSTRETENGLERQVVRPIILAACGKTINESEIGIKCSVCGRYDCKEHSFLCRDCGRSLCIHHVKFFQNKAGKNIPYCETHYRKAIFNKNMWV